MTPEQLREQAERLRTLATWARDEYVSHYVTIATDNYYVDLGTFGEQTMHVEVDNDDYKIDPQEIMEQSGVDCEELHDMATLMDEAAGALETLFQPKIDNVLDAMISDGTPQEAALARALHSVIYAIGDVRLVIADEEQALPASPLPWPGALRDDIDYTADDFPLRYQPPPGYDWADAYGDRAAPSYAARSEAVAVANESRLLIDNLGRVRHKRNEDDSGVNDAYNEGTRWHLARCERDGIPAGRPHETTSRPRAIKEDGTLHTHGTGFSSSYRVFETATELNQAQKRLAELAGEVEVAPVPSGGSAFEPPAPVTV